MELEKAKVMANTKSTFDKIAESGVFLVLGTRDYLEETRSPGSLVEQIKMAFALGKPVLLLIEETLNEHERAELRGLFSDFPIARELVFNKSAVNETKGLEDALDELVKGSGEKK